MSDVWVRAIILICTFGAVVILIETLVSWMAGNRAVPNQTAYGDSKAALHHLSASIIAFVQGVGLPSA